MKKVLLFISMLLAAVLITSLYSCTQDGGENDNRHRQGETDPEEIALNKACEAIEQVGKFYSEYNSIEELEKHAEEISKIESVEDVYFTNTAMFVNYKDFMTISYCIYPELDEPLMDISDFSSTRQIRTRMDIDRSTTQLDLGSAVIIDQQPEYNWEEYKKQLELYLEAFEIDTKIEDNPPLSFYEGEIFKYDIVLILSHGMYDSKKKLHWLGLSSDELFDRNEYQEMTIKEKVYNFVHGEKYHNYYKGYIENEELMLNVRKVKNKNGQINEKVTFAISEKFISSQQMDFKKEDKAIVFSCACESLKGGDGSWLDDDERNFDFAKAFVDRGAAVYFGYDETNGAGQLAGFLLLEGILTGQSLMGAYNALPDNLVHNQYKLFNGVDFTRWWTADLLYYPDKFNIMNDCLILPYIQKYGETEENYIVKAQAVHFMSCYNREDINSPYEWYTWTNPVFTYGFEISTTEDFSSPDMKYLGGEHIGQGDCCLENFLVSFSRPVPKKDLSPETTYYYRAFFYDGTNRYYSDVAYFTTPKQERIDQVIPEDIREQMEPFIPIYDGNNPPTIEGVFVIDSPEVVHDTTNNYKKGDTGFTPIYMRFLNQDFMNNTLDYEERDVYNGKVVDLVLLLAVKVIISPYSLVRQV